MRRLTSSEKRKVELLTKNSVSLTLIQPTKTALKKSIMDATAPVRSFLKSNGVHDYQNQFQGPKNKIIINSRFLTETKSFQKQTSLYRPKTKDGDPRIWIYGLKSFVAPDDIIALLFHDSVLYVFNLTRLDLLKIVENRIGPIYDLLDEITTVSNSVADELLDKLKWLAKKGPVKSLLDADTSVGRTLEDALGIQINSSTKPDYKGIELKSFRAGRTSRKNLFAQVPDWKLSKFKSSSEILDNFGYQRGKDFKLYCTVSAEKRNSQGLMLKLDSDIEQLIENSGKSEIGDFVVWPLEILHQRLITKHNETFWIAAETELIDCKKYFNYISVEHTKKPILTQFDLLIDQGIITLDHLIKRTSSGGAKEKGPIFKIKPSYLGLLFPPSKTYSLIDK